MSLPSRPSGHLATGPLSRRGRRSLVPRSGLLRASPAPEVEAPAIIALPPEAAGPYIIQGRVADSVDEFRYYRAALKVGWPDRRITYRVGYFGGRGTPGGVEVDFYFDSYPMPTLVFVNGEYWHSGEMGADDWEQQARLYDALRGTVRIENVWASDVQTDEQAEDAVLRSAGRP